MNVILRLVRLWGSIVSYSCTGLIFLLCPCLLLSLHCWLSFSRRCVAAFACTVDYQHYDICAVVIVPLPAPSVAYSRCGRARSSRIRLRHCVLTCAAAVLVCGCTCLSRPCLLTCAAVICPCLRRRLLTRVAAVFAHHVSVCTNVCLLALRAYSRRHVPTCAAAVLVPSLICAWWTYSFRHALACVVSEHCATASALVMLDHRTSASCVFAVLACRISVSVDRRYASVCAYSVLAHFMLCLGLRFHHACIVLPSI